MADFLDILCFDARKSVKRGYYAVESDNPDDLYVSPGPPPSLAESIRECARIPVISEIKVASPASGVTRQNLDIGSVAREMEQGGAVGISVVTEPQHFKGSIHFLSEARQYVTLPLLMKDIIVDPEQVITAQAAGASAILLIQSLFDRGYGASSLEETIDLAHAHGLEVLLETHTQAEFSAACATHADLIGINNRDLTTLEVDITTTKTILETAQSHDRIIVSESGITTPADIRLLRACGVDAFLVGTSILRANNVRQMVERLVTAL